MPRSTPEIPNASMADIAFLLLTFFLVTTTIANDRGLIMQLPPPPEARTEDFKVQEHNMFKIQINSVDQLLVEGDFIEDVSGIKEQIKKFILNNGRDHTMSDSPERAIVSLKTDRGTSHKRFVQILDIIQSAYYDLWAEQAGVTNKQFREAASDLTVEENKTVYEKGRKGLPMNISIAEPTKVGG